MLSKLPSPKSTTRKVQVGRGIGTGHGGHTAGRGTKGQKSRSGYSRPRPGFEGGQMPLSRRLPTYRGRPGKGVTRRHFTAGIKKFELQLSEVVEKIEGTEVNNETLFEAGLITISSKKMSVKILFDKEIDKKLEVAGVQLSSPAKAAILKAGGTVA